MLQGIRALIIRHIKNHLWCYIIITTALEVGLLLGVLAVNWLGEAQFKEIDHYLQLFWQQTGADSGELNNGQLLLGNLFFLLLLYILGISVIGIPLIPLAVLLKGFALCFTVTVLIEQGGWSGFLILMAALLPYSLILLPAWILAGVITLAFALRIVARLTQQSYNQLGFRSFNLALTALLLLVGITTVLQTYLSPALIKLAAGYLGY